MYEIERRNYIDHVLRFQHRMGLSNDKMAELLNLSTRTYDRFIAGQHIQSEFDLIMRVYELSGKMMFVMTGAKVPREAEDLQTYLQLTDDNKDLIDSILRAIYEKQCRKEREVESSIIYPSLHAGAGPERSVSR